MNKIKKTAATITHKGRFTTISVTAGLSEIRDVILISVQQLPTVQLKAQLKARGVSIPKYKDDMAWRLATKLAELSSSVTVSLKP